MEVYTVCSKTTIITRYTERVKKPKQNCNVTGRRASAIGPRLYNLRGFSSGGTALPLRASNVSLQASLYAVLRAVTPTEI